jgi:tRNA/rRNA methyltransferase
MSDPERGLFEGADAPTPAIILVEPQLGENIGAAARAMLNCGLLDMRLVAPRDGWPNDNAIAMASGADVVLNRAQVFDTVADATADLGYLLATTARPRDMTKLVLTPREAVGEINHRLDLGAEVGLLFGPERSGLTNEDVVRTDGVIRVPLNPNFSSLNLAQAVLLLGYEWFQSRDDSPPSQLSGDSPPAPTKEREFFYDRLEDALTDSGFLYPPHLAPTIKRNMRNMFNRAGLTRQDVSTLHGALKALMLYQEGAGNPRKKLRDDA